MCQVQARAQLPVTLVLGMSISVAALRHMLPVKAADVLQAKEFRLVQVLTSHSFRASVTVAPAMRSLPSVNAGCLCLRQREPLHNESLNTGAHSQEQGIGGNERLSSCSQCLMAVQAKALLESVVSEVLLGQRFHGLLFHHRLLDDLLHHFLSHDFSMTCIRQGLQVCSQYGLIHVHSAVESQYK